MPEVSGELDRRATAFETLPRQEQEVLDQLGMRTTYEAAVGRAEKVPLVHLHRRPTAAVRYARTAVDLVQGVSTTPEQRNAQYRRIAKLPGLIVLTAPVRQSLAAWAPMLALERPVVPYETPSR